MGATYELLLPGYGIGLALLTLVALGAMVFARFGVKDAPRDARLG